MSWNKGSAKFTNRLNEIQQIIIQNKPEICFITRSQHKKGRLY